MLGTKFLLIDFNKNTFVVKLSDAEENMNVVLEKVKMTTKKNKTLYLWLTNYVCYLLFEEIQGKIS